MIRDILEKIDFDLDKAIIDNYKLKDGLYVKIGDNIEFYKYKFKKDCDKKMCLTDLEDNIASQMYEWFCKRDYISNYLNSNKSIDPPKKRIHNNNYLTLFCKAKEFNDENKDYFIEKLYENLIDFKSFNKKKEKEVLEDFKDYIFDEKRQKDVEIKKNRFLKVFEEIKNKKELIKENEYIKIFFDEDIKKYENEAKIYYALKIYNKIEYTYKIDNKIYGLSDFNVGLNAKKPFLAHKTRGFELPFLVEKDEIILHKKLFDFLKYVRDFNKEAKNNKSGIYVYKENNNDVAEIVDFDIVVSEDRIYPEFIYKDFLSKDGEDEKIERYSLLYEKINEIFYNKTLSLYSDVWNKLPHKVQTLFYLTRDAMKALKKGEIKPLFKVNKKYADDFILWHLKENRLKKAQQSLNLKLSILEYEGERMDIKNSLKNIEEKIENLEELNEDEFFILAGQIIKYLLDKSKKSEKRADMIEPFLRAGKVKKLKEEIESLFFNYKHEIPLNYRKFNNALALVESFECDRVKRDKLLVGILADNIFYKKDEK
ncbi:hypothetical protein FE773_07095 [Caminibacter mediatlanticus TB-2]|uniref:CRISPR-associated protein Csh1 n=2 Tax=Caminibacter mediatlanticus TaxID=291048 RepID=A0ABX5VBN1_9BACT|nr:hypothetical protein FE773_07095 [Caminibacter mediatlanticus TB-2]